MSTKKRGLGKGLGALLADSSAKPKATTNANTKAKANRLSSPEYSYITISSLTPGKFQPRNNFSDAQLQELAESIKIQGILQPLIVREITANNFEIIAGERRWRAAQLSGLQKVPVIIKKLDDKSAAAIALIENMQREDLNAIEEATAITKLVNEFQLTHLEAAKALGKSRTTISNLLRVLNLNADVQELLKTQQIELGHAKVLLGLDGTKQSEIAKMVVLKKLSVRATEQLIATLSTSKNSKNKSIAHIDPDILKLQQSIADRLGATVAIEHSTKGNGKVVVSYNNLEQLEGILEIIN